MKKQNIKKKEVVVKKDEVKQSEVKSQPAISEVESVLNEVYANFFTVLPDIAFIKRG